MATMIAIARNVFETISVVQSRAKIISCNQLEYSYGRGPRKPLRMCWVRDIDSEGRTTVRMRWAGDPASER